MGTFHTGCRIERFPDSSRGIVVRKALVDTGAEFTWVPAASLGEIGLQPVKSEDFVMADGKIIRRQVGFAVVRVGKRFTVDEVVFGERGDLTLLGARTLEGLGLSVDARHKRLVAAGPAPAAAAIRPHVARAMGIIVGQEDTLKAKSSRRSRKPSKAPRKPAKAAKK